VFTAKALPSGGAFAVLELVFGAFLVPAFAWLDVIKAAEFFGIRHTSGSRSTTVSKNLRPRAFLQTEA
jgi:hypothetical protein